MMKVEKGVVCIHCRKQYSTTQHMQTIRCCICEEANPLNNTDHEIISTGTKTHSSEEQAKSFCDSKRHHLPQIRICGGRWRPDSVSPTANSSPLVPISNWEVKSGKRALLCGVTYNKQKVKLKGTMYDVNNMRDLLINYFQFPSSSIHILAETETNFHPTKSNIQAALRWLVKDCQSGDSLVFYFSGHGLRQPDFNNDEVDGWDETICPLDFRTAGMILDNELNETIVRPLQKGVRLHAIIDACHSGTILDLPHVYSPKGEKWVTNYPPSGANKGTNGGLAISFSACEDDQLAADTSAFSENGRQMEGAMTYTFRKAVSEKPKVTYRALLALMHKIIEDTRKARCFKLRRLFHREILQEPLMSSSEVIDIDRELML